MLYTVVASRVHIFTHFSLLKETDYQVFCATYVSHQGNVSIINSKNEQEWEKKDKQRGIYPFSYHGRCVNLSDIILILCYYYIIT